MISRPAPRPDVTTPAASVLLFAGKGGVGKTTVAAATAVRAARLGLRTALVSTDRAHSISDVLGAAAGPPIEGLTVVEDDSRAALEAEWEPVRAFLSKVATRSGVASVRAREVMTIPGLDEVFALESLVQAARSDHHDLVVVDCAPTAETLRMLTLPAVIEWWLSRLRPLVEPAHTAVGAGFEQLTGVALPGTEMIDALEKVAASVSRAGELLADPARVGVRLVCIPNSVVTAETRRLLTYLSLFGARVDAVVVNQLLAPVLDGPATAAWRDDEEAEVAALVGDVAPVPVLRAARSRHEVIGADALEELAVEIHGEEDPTVRHLIEPTMRWDLGDEPSLSIEMPVVDVDDVDLARIDDDLVITLGPHRRHISLPDVLVTRAIRGAKVEQGTLRVRFASHAS